MWLAPNEKFLPGNVKTFLANVHAEREKVGGKKIKDIGDNLGKYSHYYQNDAFEDLIYYEEAPEQTEGAAAVQNNRKRRNFEKDTSLEHIFELPIDDASENWYLVSNDNLGEMSNVLGKGMVHASPRSAVANTRTHDVTASIALRFLK